MPSKENDRITREPSWDDRKDEWTEQIEAAFPTRSGSHEEYGIAMENDRQPTLERLS